MKNIPLTRTTVIVTIFAVCILFLVSTGYGQEGKDIKAVSEKQDDATFDNNKNKKDAQFLVNAVEMNREQIKLGQLAQKNGTTSHVKELGTMMEDAHRKSLNDLTALADSKNITIPALPNDSVQNTYKKLNETKGSDFDKAYVDLMVSEHKDAIASFEKASKDSNDIDIKNWATSTLPILRSHLDKSIECQKECAKMSFK